MFGVERGGRAAPDVPATPPGDGRGYAQARPISASGTSAS